MMMTTHSFFNAALSRLPEPEIFLAAFAVAKSVMHIFESPIMMIRQAVSTLVSNSQSYFTVRRFFVVLTLISIGILSLVAFTDLADWILSNIIGVEGQVHREAVIILSIFAFFPAVAALRNFMQGIAVLLNKTPLFTAATFCRMVYVFVLVLLVERLSFLPGAVFAGLMFFTAVGMEGVVIFLGVKLSEKDIPGKLDAAALSSENRSPKKSSQNPITHMYIFRFFWPLVITSLIHMAMAPIVNMGLARSVSPEIAISAYTVAWNLGILILSPTFMFHQQVINYFDNTPEKTKSLKKFGLYLGIVIFLIMLIVSYTSLGFHIMKDLIGVTESIALLARDVLRLMIFMPPIIMLRQFYWGVLMKEGQTGSVSMGKVANIIALITVIIILLMIGPANPAIIGALAIIIAEGMEVLYLSRSVHRLKILSG